MANTNTKARKNVAAKEAEKTNVESVAQIHETSTAKSTEKKSYKIKKNLDPNMYVTVKNGFNGTLVYKSKKTGERFIWESFGDEQEMELLELKSARNSYKVFFENNWFLFDDPEIIEWLGVEQYYKHALDYDSFDKLFEKTPSEIEEIVNGLSKGQKKTVAFRAKQLISEGTIDSIKVISALEKSLNVELIEH